MTTSTIALLAALRAGDRAALSTLMERHLPSVRLIVAGRMQWMLRDLNDVDDVVQEACHLALKDLSKFEYRGDGSFVRWLATIATHRVQDHLRRALPRRRREVDLPAHGGTPLTTAFFAAPGPSPSQVAIGVELEERLERELLALDERTRIALVLRKFSKLSYEEIAVELGLGSASSARSLVSRALAQLSKLVLGSESSNE